MVSLAVTRAWPRLHVPGIAVAAAAVAMALAVSRFLPALSPAIIAVTAGAALHNLGWLHERLRPGLQFVAKKVLRAAIVLLGLQIALPQVLTLGRPTLLIVVAATGLTFVLTPLIGRRLGVAPGSSLLIATGVSICGASAIAAMHESAGSDDDDAASALGVVTLYGTAAIVFVPLVAGWLGLTGKQLGVWAGAAVHEVAQVAAIGAASGAAVLAVAVTAKLARVVLLAPMVAATAFRHRLRHAGPVSAEPATAVHTGRTIHALAEPPVASQAKRPPIMPLFVAGFLAMVVVRSLGVVPEAVTTAVPQVTSLLLAAALFGLGTGIDVRKLARGGRAVLLGGISTALITGISLAGVTLLV
ncbi:YeiH family protein [Nonomuraea typhae]|uniref:YeiH family protein n=1 Tax=Nonomuraea typhae TaxID=2603600 RepID=UPI0012F8A00F|nr:putative sulfate exporter family transporter [Nonomuraea typhae]